MKRTVIFLIAALALALTLTACSAAPADTPADTPVSQETAAPAAQESQREPAWALDPAAVTDDFAADTLIRLPELALSGPGFTFDSPDELTSQQLYLLFQAWTEPAEADACYDAAAGVYVYASTAEILNKALARCGNWLGRAEKVDIAMGDIVKIDNNGRITRGIFDASKFYRSSWGYWDTSLYPRLPHSEEEHLALLKSVAKAFGFTGEMVDRLLEQGFSTDDIEEILYEGSW